MLTQSFKSQKNLKILEIMDQNAIYICISWYRKNSPICNEKNAGASRTQGVCHVIDIVFESSLDKVWLCQVLSL